MTLDCIWEHNGNDTLLYSADFVGAYSRGSSLDIATRKMADEVASYSNWLGADAPKAVNIQIIQEKKSELNIADADSDVIFNSEILPLSADEYGMLKAIALKSANDFLRLYNSIPERFRCEPFLDKRETFYGDVPRSADAIYFHTKNVNEYYFAEIGVKADNEGTIFDCRARAFAHLEQMRSFLLSEPQEGSYGEIWSTRKLLRRFVWHDRIHAKAMWRMIKRHLSNYHIENPFCFRDWRFN